MLTTKVANTRMARRMKGLRPSFLREILEVASADGMISFAGGLPNPDYYPVSELSQAAIEVMEKEGKKALHYGASAGHEPLRQWIAEHYLHTHGVQVDSSQVMITNGSQQAIDFIGKLFINEGDTIVMEGPGYLGAMQGFLAYGAHIRQVKMFNDGPDLEELEEALRINSPAVFYCVPNFQNPTGITYSQEKRQAVAELCRKYGAIIVEDDPYGQLHYSNGDYRPINIYNDQSIMLGSFSKTIAPGLRLGWIVAQDEQLFRQLLLIKQSADLHSGFLSQFILHHYLTHNDIEKRLKMLSQHYGQRRDCMLAALQDTMPKQVRWDVPLGGMFIWMRLPAEINAAELLQKAMAVNVVFVPGYVFYNSEQGGNCLRLNFTNAPPDLINKGIELLAKCVWSLMKE